MQSTLRLSPLAACVLMAMSYSTQAAEPINLNKTTLKSIEQQFHLGVPGIKPASPATNALQFVQQHTDKKQITHVRMQQEYLGFTVVGGYAILHSAHTAKSLAQASNVSMNGVVYTGLQDELGKPQADFVKRGQEALAQFLASYKGKELSEQHVTPIVYIDAQHRAHWAYKVSVLVRHTDQIPARPSAIIDAQTFKPFVEWNDIKTFNTVRGRGFGGNQKMGQYEFGSGTYPLLDMTRDAEEEKCFMENTDVKVVDMKHRYSSNNKPMSFLCKQSEENQDTFMTGYNADGYDKDNGAFSPTNDALYAGFVIKHMYHDWYNVEALVKSDGSPMQLVMRVHYGDGYENAYWDGEKMTFGDGENMMYPLVSLGVGGHEISHGFTEQHSDLAYYGQSGGMNEAFSDMAAQAAEYYSTGKNSWQIGPEIMKEDSGYDALRYMDKPSRDGSSIDTADDYYGGLDVHYSSGVFNRLYYLLANIEGWNARKSFDVMVKANMDYWTPYSTFNEGGCGVISAAKDLGYSVDDVKNALTVVAIKFDACESDSPPPTA